jgi:hypothetical protein
LVSITGFKAGIFFAMKQLSDQEKLVALSKKLEEAEEKLKLRLKNFRGVPHESAMGELNYSELKVLEDYVESLKAEVKALKEKLGQK